MQLASLKDARPWHLCIYPHATSLARQVVPGSYPGKPFTRLLALGEPQLSFRAFDLHVLESYRNDPRYSYSCDGIVGFISIGDDAYRDGAFPKRDKILLQAFGFGYASDGHRAVVAFVCDLAGLSPEHQQIWQARQLQDRFRMHEHFYMSQVCGEFPDEIPIFNAFIREQRLINEMCGAIGYPALFRDVPKDGSHSAPRFGFLVRPTVKEYSDFVHLLDKLMSDNLNRDFFRGRVPLEEDKPRSDGKVVVQQIGTIRLLETWLTSKFKARDPRPLAEAVATFKEVRQLRQKPAHQLEDDRFDPGLLSEQRALVRRAYEAIRTIRLVFANHPAAQSVRVEELLYRGQICDY